MAQQRDISVAMCTYNGTRYLREQLDSIACQTRLPMELVVVDDQSTDGTRDLLAEFARTAPFPVRVHVNAANIGGGSKGITRNFETAVSHTTGELIVPCDQDDIWLPEKLARLAGRMDAEPTLDAAFSDAKLIKPSGEPDGVHLSQVTGMTLAEKRRLEGGETLPVMLSMTKVYGSAMIFHARVKAFMPAPTHWWFDAWMAMMASLHGGIAYLPEDLYLYRIHANQSSAQYQAPGGLGASLNTSQKVQRWRRSAREYWESAEPQLTELCAQLESEHDPKLQPYLDYLRGRMDLLRFRAQLPSNRLARVARVLPRAGQYQRFFNGWRSIAKDLTA